MRNALETLKRSLSTLTALALLCGLVSCEMPPPTTGQTQAVNTDSAEVDESTEQFDPGASLGVLIHRLDMPLDVSLDACWAVVDEAGVPTLTHGMWQANGMRIGVLHADQYQGFTEALPTTLGESRAMLFSSPHPTAIRSTPRLVEPVLVDLTDPPRSPTIYRAIDGRMQLLARAARFPETGQPYIEIIPHHYKPKAELIPRSPLEKALDGKVFTPLAARMALMPDSAIIIGLNRPRPITETETLAEETVETTDTTEAAETTTDSETVDESGEAEEPSDQPLTVIDRRSEAPTAIPDGLGKSLLAGIRAGQETQILIVITVVEE